MTQADEKTGVRIQQFLSAENITQAQFADSLGITRASISHILAGRNKPSFDFFFGVLDRYPNLSLEWLISGKGKMYKTPGAELFAPEPTDRQTPSAGAQSQDPSRPQPRFHSSSDGLTANPAPDSLFTSAPEPVTAPNSLPRTGGSGNTQFSGGVNAPVDAPQRPVNQRRISKLVVFYDDGTYKELK